MLLKKKPRPVGNLKAEAAPNEEMKVALSWINPSAYLTGEPLTISKINVYRNGDLIKTLTETAYTATGGDVSYADVPPKPGYQTYGVEVVADDGSVSNKSEARTGYVGPFSGFDPPYTFNLADEEVNARWTLTADASNPWEFRSGKLAVDVNNQNPVNATAKSPVFNLDKTKAYRVSFGAETTNKANEVKFSYGYGLKDAEPTVLKTLERFNPAANNKPEQFEYDFSPAESGQYSFVWTAEAERMTASYYNNTLSLSAISVVEIPVVADAATGLTATAAADHSNAVTLTWKNPTQSPTGIPVSGLRAKIERNGAIVAEIATSGADGSFVDSENLPSGYHTYRVIIANANGDSEPTAAVRSDFAGMPYTVPFSSDFANAPYAWTETQTSETPTSERWIVSGGKAVLSKRLSEMADILLSPTITLSSSKVYELTYNSKSDSYSSVPVGIVIEQAGVETPAWETIGETKIDSKNNTDRSVRFGVPADGDYTLGLYAIYGSTGSTTVTLTVNSVSIVEIAPTPNPATNVSAAANEDYSAIEVVWDMPSTTPEGVALQGTLTASVYRGASVETDAEPAYTVEGTPGETLSWTDTEATEGINSYVIVVSLPAGDDGVAATSSVALTSQYFARPTSTPFYFRFAADSDLSNWKFPEVKDKTPFSQGEDGTLICNEHPDDPTNYRYQADAWIITPLLEFDTAIDYVIEIEACGCKSASSTSSHNTPLTVFVADEPTVDAMNRGYKCGKIEINSPEFAVYNVEYPLNQNNLTREVPSKAVKFIGIHAGEYYSYPYAEIRSVDIHDKTTTGIAGVGTVTSPMVYRNGIISAADGVIIRVSDMSGRVVATGNGSVDMTRLPSGVYIVNAAGYEAFKFVK